MLPTYQRTSSSQPRKPFLGCRSPEKLLIILVVASFTFVCFGAFFLLPDNFGQEKVNRIYRHFKEAPEIFLPPPPIRHSDGDGPDIHLIGDRAKLNDKINSELGHDIIEKPETEFAQQIQSEPNSSIDVNKPEEAIMPPVNNNIVKDAASSLENQIVHSDDKDLTTRERREKVKEVSTWPLHLYVLIALKKCTM